MEKDILATNSPEPTEADKIIAAVGDGVTVHGLDFRILYQNQTMKSIFGDCLGKLCHEAYKKSSSVCPECPVATCFSTGEVYIAERTLSISNKSYVFEISVSPIRDKSGMIVAAVEVVRNATERKEAEDALRTSEERLKLVLEGSNDGFWDWNIDTGEVNLSHRLMVMLGYAPGVISTISSVMNLIHPDDKPKLRSVIYEQLSMKTSAFEVEIRMRTRNDVYDWFLYRGKIVSRDRKGNPLRAAGIASQVTERKRVEEELQYKSTHDSLTGLFNRAYFDAEMARIARSRQYPVSIVLADVDGLKQINDTFGHLAGDRVIKQAAQALQETFRGDDVVARIGGDEFAVILQNAGALVVKEAIKRVIKKQITLNAENDNYSLSLSLGSATAERSEQLYEAVKLADSRMYTFKLRQKQYHVSPLRMVS